MPQELITYYCFGPTDNDGINVISYVHNVWAAKKAMLNMYGRSESDIKWSYKRPQSRICGLFCQW